MVLTGLLATISIFDGLLLKSWVYEMKVGNASDWSLIFDVYTLNVFTKHSLRSFPPTVSWILYQFYTLFDFVIQWCTFLNWGDVNSLVEVNAQCMFFRVYVCFSPRWLNSAHLYYAESIINIATPYANKMRNCVYIFLFIFGKCTFTKRAKCSWHHYHSVKRERLCFVGLKHNLL